MERTYIMKFRKLTALFLAAVTAASLSVSASAGYVKEGTTPLIDIKQSVKGEFRRENPDGTGRAFLYNEKGEIIKGKSLVYLDMSSEYELGFRMRMYRFDKETGQFTAETYTGFTKDKNGRRYYDKGIRIIGWYKVGNSWYHFNKNGYADTGKVKIAGVRYTFDEKGKWTGKVAKSGAVPEDFKLEISENLLRKGFSTDGVISYGNIYDENYDKTKYTADVKITNRDKQVIYSMFMESGMGNSEKTAIDDKYFNSKPINDYFADAPEEADYAICDPQEIITVKVTAKGKTSELQYYPDFGDLIIHFDETAYNSYNITNNLTGYYNNIRAKNPPRDDVEYFYLD